MNSFVGLCKNIIVKAHTKSLLLTHTHFAGLQLTCRAASRQYVSERNVSAGQRALIHFHSLTFTRLHWLSFSLSEMQICKQVCFNTGIPILTLTHKSICEKQRCNTKGLMLDTVYRSYVAHYVAPSVSVCDTIIQYSAILCFFMIYYPGPYKTKLHCETVGSL